jgi:hypothetical protein
LAKGDYLLSLRQQKAFDHIEVEGHHSGAHAATEHLTFALAGG